nr:hypothetical protein [Anaeromyxobacter sp. SG26]
MGAKGGSSATLGSSASRSPPRANTVVRAAWVSVVHVTATAPPFSAATARASAGPSSPSASVSGGPPRRTRCTTVRVGSGAAV